MINEKIKTYISFAIKSGQCTLGVDNILKMRCPKIIFIDPKLSINSQKKLTNRFSAVPTFNLSLGLGTVAENVYALAISNENLAGACIKLLSENGGQII